MSNRISTVMNARDDQGDTEMTKTGDAIRDHVYAWAKAHGLDNWLTTDDYDDLIERLPTARIAVLERELAKARRAMRDADQCAAVARRD